MELWLDTIDKAAIIEAKESGLLFGITTNPSIASKADQPLEDLLEELLYLQPGPVAVQVTARNTSEMVEQAKDLYDFSDRLIVKIPVTPEGIKAISNLAHIGIPTMATAIFESLQGFLAAQAGADYAAPYVEHIGDKRLEVLKTFQTLLDTYLLPTKIIAAALVSTDQVVQCLELGVAAITLKESIFYGCYQPPAKTLEYLTKIEGDWQKAPPSQLLPKVSAE